MKITKKIVAAATAVILSVSIAITPSYAVENRTVLVNGSVLSVQSIQESIPYIPAQEFCEALGARFQYNHSTITASISKGNTFINLSLDSPAAIINGKNVTMPNAMKISNKRIVIPMEFIASVFNEHLYYDSFKNRWMLLKEENSNLYYTVEPGDTLWKLSVTFKATISDLTAANQLSGTMLNIGQRLKVASGLTTAQYDNYTVYTKTSATLFSSKSLSAGARGYLKAWTEVTVISQDGQWYEVNTPIGNGYLYQSVVYIPQSVSNNQTQSTYFNNPIPVDTSKDTITYSVYTVKSGDTIWTIATEKGITAADLAAANNISVSAWLSIGQVLKIPQRNITAEEPVLPGYGKLADWFTQGTYILPLNEEAVVIDQETGKSFRIRRTTGNNHADVETLSSQDTQAMRDIFGGSWSWSRRAAFLEIGGSRYAISIAGMPHAGLDNQPFLANVSGRSDDWGYGPNYDAIKGNGMDGHFDLYFLNSLRHKDNQLDPEHQRNIMKATGLH